MIQQLYQTLKKTQPELFTKSLRTDDQSSSTTTTTDTNSNEVIDEDDNEEEEEEVEEEIVTLTPEMEHANTLFEQANKLINVTFNRQYET
jgi:hypothetical protein